MESNTHELVAAAENVSPSGPHPAARASRTEHYLRAAAIGICAGLLAVSFRRVLSVAEISREVLLDAMHGTPGVGWMLLPSLGAVICGFVAWLTARYSPDAVGSGIPHLKGVLLHLRELGWQRLIPIKYLGGVAVIGSGLSLGREGPSVQMGAAVAQALAKLFRTPKADIPQLLSAGAGAGLAAAFNAPLAGLIFVVEELHRELSSRTAIGALIAAVCATLMTRWLAGETPSFEVSGLLPLPLWAVPIAAAVGLCGGLGGVLFNQTLVGVVRLRRLCSGFPVWAIGAAAGLLAGLVAWWLPDAVGGGHAVAESILGGTVARTLGVLALLFLAKLLLTAASYGAGVPGGIFAPILLLGALVGACVAKLSIWLMPEFASEEQSLAALGMAALFVGSVRAPMTGIVLISEMTGGYQLLFPICIAALVAHLVAEWFRDRPIYDRLLELDIEHSGAGPQRAEPRSMYVGVQLSSAAAHRTIAEVGFPPGCLIVTVDRGGATMMPSASLTLRPGDHLSILFPGDRPESALEIVRLCTGLA